MKTKQSLIYNYMQRNKFTAGKDLEPAISLITQTV